MTTINGYTLFSHNGWSSGKPIAWRRRWQTGVGSGVTGAEQRSGLRILPLNEITFGLTPINQPEAARLEATIDQAKKSGLVCCAFYGWQDTLFWAANAGTNSVYLTGNSAWQWWAGTYIILLGADDLTYDVQQITGGEGNVFGLAGNLNFNWPVNSVCWPVLFGKFTSQEINPRSPIYESVQITVTELANSKNAQLGALPAAAPGIGQQTIPRTNTIA